MKLSIPETWQTVTISDLATYTIGGDWGKDVYFDSADYAMVHCIRGAEFRNWDEDKGATASPRKIKKTSLTNRLLKYGDILVEISGGGPEQPVGRTVLIDNAVLSFQESTPKICTNFLRLLRTTENVDSRFLNNYLNFFYKSGEIRDFQAGSNNLRNLRFNDYLEIEIPLPPLTEQHRIVAKIEELFSELEKGIESFKTAREQLKIYRQALLKRAFEGNLTAPWREQNKAKLESADALLKRIQTERAERYRQQVKEWEKAIKVWEENGKKGSKPGKPSKPKEMSPLTVEELAELPELPKGWRWVRLGNCNSVIFDGPFGSNLKSSDYVADGVRVIRLENIGNLNFVDEKESYISTDKYELLKDHTVSAGDIIFASFITEDVRVVLLPHGVTKAINKADCFCVRLFGKSANNKYVEKFLSTRQVYKRLEALIHGVGRPRINTTQLKDVAIPLCSADEQSEIVSLVEDRFSEIDNLEQTITTALQQAETLRQSILKKAFSGQLLPQDPNDEPAAQLLVRIKAEKEKTAASKQAKSANTAKVKAPKTSKTTRKKVNK